MFQQVICGVESSPASLVAVRQAARLVQPGGRLVLAAAANVAVAAHAECWHQTCGSRSKRKLKPR